MAKKPRTQHVWREGEKIEPEAFVGVVSVRATAEMLAGLDRMAAELAKTAGVEVTRSDIARKILRDAIRLHEPGASR
jgi:hypothetical protein